MNIDIYSSGHALLSSGSRRPGNQTKNIAALIKSIEIVLTGATFLYNPTKQLPWRKKYLDPWMKAAAKLFCFRTGYFSTAILPSARGGGGGGLAPQLRD